MNVKRSTIMSKKEQSVRFISNQNNIGVHNGKFRKMCQVDTFLDISNNFVFKISIAPYRMEHSLLEMLMKAFNNIFTTISIIIFSSLLSLEKCIQMQSICFSTKRYFMKEKVKSWKHTQGATADQANLWYKI